MNSSRVTFIYILIKWVNSIWYIYITTVGEGRKICRVHSPCLLRKWGVMRFSYQKLAWPWCYQYEVPWLQKNFKWQIFSTWNEERREETNCVEKRTGIISAREKLWHVESHKQHSSELSSGSASIGSVLIFTDPDPSINKQAVLWPLNNLLSLKTDEIVPTVSNNKKKTYYLIFCWHIESHWRNNDNQITEKEKNLK